MPNQRVIPSLPGVAEFALFVNGAEVPSSVVMISVNITRMVNRVGAATIVLQDGSPAAEDFPLSGGDLFTPGNAIAISAGDTTSMEKVFDGLIVRQALKVRPGKAPQLILECRHKAVKATIVRRSHCYHDMTDAEICEEILQQHGFSSANMEVAATNIRHKEMVQYQATDWDFLVSRAEMNGQVVITTNDKVIIRPRDSSGTAELTLLMGATLLELDAAMDTRDQYSSVTASAWDMANQQVATSTAAEPSGFTEQGEMAVNELADAIGAPAFTLQHAGAMPQDELQEWADAALSKARYAKIRGRARFAGIATLDAGDIVQLNGLGSKFTGKAFVSGVRHDYDTEAGWTTQAQFGEDPDWFIEQHRVTVPKAGGNLPGAVGLHTAVVTDNEDPAGEMRVRVKIPYVDAADDGVWARMSLSDAGNDRGLFFRPEVGDEVLIGFLYDDPRYPVILGMLHSSALPAPQTPSNDNHLKGFTSRSKMHWLVDDDKIEMSFDTPAGNKVVLSEDSRSIEVADQHGNKVLMNEQGVVISDANTAEVISLDTQQGRLRIKANTKVVVEAPQIELVENATHPLVFGDALLTYLNQVVQTFNTHMHPGELALGSMPVTPAPPVPPLPPATPSLLSVKVKTG